MNAKERDIDREIKDLKRKIYIANGIISDAKKLSAEFRRRLNILEEEKTQMRINKNKRK